MEPGLLPSDAAIAVGQTSVALLAWRHRGVIRVTVIAKATFSIACDTAMPRTRAQKIITQEAHHGNMPTRSVRLTSDLIPYLEHTDVIFTGSAYAPPGTTVESMHARLGVYDGARALLDKALLVRQKGGFREVPLVYERAYGGIGWPDNPFGVGVGSDKEPSIVDPDEPTRTVGFGPISQSLPTRKKLLRGARRALSLDAVPTVPDDINWDYFQAAPHDQRIDWLRGDEWIVLDGLHPSLPSARTRLPGARGHALVYGLEAYGVAPGQPLDLHADVLRIDGDDRHVTVTFRGLFPVAEEAALHGLTVLAGVETHGAPIAWPEEIPARASIEDPMTEALPAAAGGARTMVLDMPKNMPAYGAGIGARTIVEAPRGKSDQPALPFAPGASPLASGSGSAHHAPREDRWSGTLELAPADEEQASQRDAIPFSGATRPAPASRPMAPKAPDPAPIAAITPPPTLPITPPVTPPVAKPPPPPEADKREVSVGVAPPKEEPPPPPPPKAAPVIKPAAPPALKKGLYGKFGGKR